MLEAPDDVQVKRTEISKQKAIERIKQHAAEQEMLRINNIVAELRVLSDKLGEHWVLFPGVEIVDTTELSALRLGGNDPDSGNKLDVSELLRYIADMMEV